MAVSDTPVQAAATAGSGSAATLAPTLGTAATAGSILFLGVVVGVTGKTIVATGYSLVHTDNSGAFSAVLLYKIATGGETSADPNWTGSGTCGAFLIEMPATDLNTAAVDASNEDATSVSTVVTSQSSGAASNTQASAVVYTMFAIDDPMNDADGGRGYSAGYTERAVVNAASTARPGLLFATKIVSSVASQSNTYTTTDIGQEMYGAIAIFAAAAGGGVTGPLVGARLAGFGGPLVGRRLAS